MRKLLEISVKTGLLSCLDVDTVVVRMPALESESAQAIHAARRPSLLVAVRDDVTGANRRLSDAQYLASPKIEHVKLPAC
jgi:hypothetical protein